MHKSMLLCLAAIGLVLTACGSPAARPATAASFTIQATDFKFEPAKLEARVGQPVKFTIINKGAVDHDFGVMDIPVAGAGVSHSDGDQHDMSNMTIMPSVHVMAATGKTSTLEFTPTQAGAYQFLCTVAGHKEAGMSGQLVVK